MTNQQEDRERAIVRATLDEVATAAFEFLHEGPNFLSGTAAETEELINVIRDDPERVRAIIAKVQS